MANGDQFGAAVPMPKQEDQFGTPVPMSEAQKTAPPAAPAKPATFGEVALGERPATDMPLTNPKGGWRDALAPTERGVANVIGGTVQAGEGLYNTFRHPINTAKGLAELPSQAAEIPSAIHDINASPDPSSLYMQAAENTAGQGAGQALLALGTAGAAKAAPKVIPPVIRAAGKVAPIAIPPAVGAAAGAVLGHPLWGAVSGIGGEFFPKIGEMIEGSRPVQAMREFGLNGSQILDQSLEDITRGGKSEGVRVTPETAKAIKSGSADVQDLQRVEPGAKVNPDDPNHIKVAKAYATQSGKPMLVNPEGEPTLTRFFNRTNTAWNPKAAPAASTIPQPGEIPQTPANVKDFANKVVDQNIPPAPKPEPGKPIYDRSASKLTPTESATEVAHRSAAEMANGKRIFDATRDNPDVMDAIHKMTRVELRQAAIDHGIDMGQQTVTGSKFAGEGGISREGIINKMLDKGVKPEDIPLRKK